MKFIRYAKYTGEPADAIDLEELVKRLGDSSCKAASNRNSTASPRLETERSMDPLREASSAALQEGDLLPKTPCPTSSAKCSMIQRREQPGRKGSPR